MLPSKNIANLIYYEFYVMVTQIMQKLKKLFNFIPLYVIIPAALWFGLQMAMYYITQGVNNIIDPQRIDLAIPVIDDNIPVWTPFVLFYGICYPVWILSFITAAYVSKRRFYVFLTSLLLSILIGFIFYIAVPAYIERPDIKPNNIFDKLTLFIYSNDNPVNLFPSFHCLIGWLDYIAIRRQKQIPRWYRITFMIISIGIVASTVFIKQHFFIDLVAGVLFAEIIFFVVDKFYLSKPVENLFEKLNTKLKLNYIQEKEGGMPEGEIKA